VFHDRLRIGGNKVEEGLQQSVIYSIEICLGDLEPSGIKVANRVVTICDFIEVASDRSLDQKGRIGLLQSIQYLKWQITLG
jgi:hypothetical protein